nr:head-tail adaptor protein [Bacillus subtilis]
MSPGAPSSSIPFTAENILTQLRYISVEEQEDEKKDQPTPKHRLTFQKKTKIQDEELNWIDSYEDLFTVWGAVEGSGSLGNNETMIA